MEKIIGLTDIVDSDTEFFPLLSSEDEQIMNAEDVPDELSILPLRNTVLFPGVVIPITVGRDKSINLIKDAYAGTKTIGVVAQKEADTEDPSSDDLQKIGTIARLIKILQMPDGNTTAIIQGKKRFEITEITQSEPYFKAKVKSLSYTSDVPEHKSFDALISSVKDLSIQIIEKSPAIPSEAVFAINNIESPVFLVNFISSNLNVDNGVKQELLEITDLEQRANRVLEIMTKELQMLELKHDIQTKVKVDMDKQQRDYMLNQQLKTIQEELGGGPHDNEIRELNEKATKKKWTDATAEVFKNEMVKLQRMNPAAAEYSIQLGYLDLLVELPWNEFSQDNNDLKNALEVLNNDHYGLEKIKDRIIEHLAVLKLKKNLKSPILCFVGPPGVGKTSLGKSIANALDRKFVRMSLGGVRDEAELRGHRKTYIGAMPGRIIQSLKKIKTSNPVFMLDEVDKVSGSNFSGDPQSALLEILDPEQNNSFYDNYLEVEYDLSNVMFIATANTLSTVHPALRDRMEIINLSGYIQEEKVEIAKRHLLPKQLEEHGVKNKQVKFNKSILESIIQDYTREAGVRLLEKQIAKIIRNRARFIAMDESYEPKLKNDDLKDILGIPRFQKDRDITNNVAGVVTGLAWTSVGGEILFIEVSLSKGKGLLKLTGNLGDVMKESAGLAFEFLKSHHEELDIDPCVFDKWNVHIHVPEGATPKDGPSAGITMLTALTSAFTQRKVMAKLAMTGEITLRGKVLPVGGIKEKILAAKRANIKDIILSKENRSDIEEISDEYIKGLNFIFVDNMLDVIEHALLDKKVTNPRLIN
ncbi:MAG: endopeptidase La [Lentimicrobiaceae bacterium]|jgi:ATP-dependent Lon protease|nr:endopeptidase La [Lentimicrobiaceae bacterium]MBT3454443.1 endopeptidase La [Lentimicrobiaceae bacterium]MBT3818053.1 endopeptidase La [Lentimicrobiaceae bacterium]MBT4061832.1 endopeptidase La [Lentimicrobiaceae bacterium]MBT4190651.1 endopeptidase La [Lentimicrobiaceae bacterium]